MTKNGQHLLNIDASPERIERFMGFVTPEPNSGCWLWTGALNRDGYGSFYAGQSRLAAHRYSYLVFVGAIPGGLQIDHICRVRSCVNHSHLRPVTVRQNILCGEGLAAINARKTHCLRGHPLFGENLYVSPNGKRHCKTCQRKRGLAFYSRSH